MLQKQITCPVLPSAALVAQLGASASGGGCCRRDDGGLTDGGGDNDGFLARGARGAALACHFMIVARIFRACGCWSSC